MKLEAKHAFALVLAGVLPGFILAILSLPVDYAIPILAIIVVLTAFLLVYGVGVYEEVLHDRKTRHRWTPPLKVAVLCEKRDLSYKDELKDNYVWTHTSPEEWTELLGKAAKEEGLSVELTRVGMGQEFDDCVAILNPYGGSYPEDDLKNLSTMSKIIGYVKEGGVFVNVADVPSYWAHNSVLGRKLDIAQSVYVPIQSGQTISVIPTKLFELTPIAKELALKIVQVDPVKLSLSPVLGPGSQDAVSTRLAVMETNMENCLSPVKAKYLDGKTKDMTPLCFVHYGKGDVLLSLFWLDTDKNDRAQIDAIRRAICLLLVRNVSAKSRKREA